MCDNCGSAMGKNAKKCPCCGSPNGVILSSQYTNTNNNKSVFKMFVVGYVFIFIAIISFTVFNSFKSFKLIDDNLVKEVFEDSVIEVNDNYDYSQVIEKYRDKDVNWLNVFEEFINSDEEISEFDLEMIIIKNIDYNSYYNN